MSVEPADPWADRAVFAAVAEECRSARERVLASLAARLNELHGVNLPLRYWRIALGSWLLYHIQQLEDRRRLVAADLAAAPESVVALAEEDFLIPRDTLDYLGLFQTKPYDLMLRTLGLRSLGKKAPEARMPREPLPSLNKPVGIRALYHAARRYVYTAARRLCPGDVLTDNVYPMSRRHEILAKAMDYRLWPLAAELPERLRVPGVLDARRRALADLPCEGPIDALAVSSLPWCLPALFLEGFPAARAHAKRVLGRPPKAMLHSVGIYYDELYKLCAAEAALAGTPLIGVQHGGHYGCLQWSNPEWHERSIADAYVTWGWKEDAATTPLPVPWLWPPPPRRPEAGEVLIVTTTGLQNATELFPAPMGREWRDFFAWRGRFLDALGPEHRAASRLRLFPKDYGWGERKEAVARWPDLRIDDRRHFHEAVSSAALIVTDHAGTTFLEALAWDIPSVHFWDDRIWASRPSALAAYEPLRRAGIIHDSPESAARQVALVRRDPREWWERSAEVRREFVSTYARMSPDWAAQWAAFLRKTARGA